MEGGCKRRGIAVRGHGQYLRGIVAKGLVMLQWEGTIARRVASFSWMSAISNQLSVDWLVAERR